MLQRELRHLHAAGRDLHPADTPASRRHCAGAASTFRRWHAPACPTSREAVPATPTVVCSPTSAPFAAAAPCPRATPIRCVRGLAFVASRIHASTRRRVASTDSASPFRFASTRSSVSAARTGHRRNAGACPTGMRRTRRTGPIHRTRRKTACGASTASVLPLRPDIGMVVWAHDSRRTPPA